MLIAMTLRLSVMIFERTSMSKHNVYAEQKPWRTPSVVIQIISIKHWHFITHDTITAIFQIDSLRLITDIFERTNMSKHNVYVQQNRDKHHFQVDSLRLITDIFERTNMSKHNVYAQQKPWQTPCVIIQTSSHGYWTITNIIQTKQICCSRLTYSYMNQWMWMARRVVTAKYVKWLCEPICQNTMYMQKKIRDGHHPYVYPNVKPLNFPGRVDFRPSPY